MRTPLNLLLGLALAAGLPAIESAAQTAKYPDRPVKMMVGFTAGGGTDVVARILAQKMSETIGQTVFVENRPGASGLLAVEAVAKSPPDGYTLLMGTQTTYAVAPTLYRKTSIDPSRDFAGISMSAVSPLVLVVHPSVPAQSVKDVIAMAKAKAGTLNFGSGGLGTTPHMTGELFQSVAGIRMAHVAYRGEAPAINDLLGGQIPLMFANLSAVIGNVRAGQLRALAVTSAQRAPAAPEIPTVAESGLPGFETSTWFALVAPAGTPPDVLARLNAEVKRSLAQADVKQRFAGLGMTAEDSTPEGLDAYIKSEIAKWTKVIKDADIKAVE
ncbi:MAG: tripartite tricarboxylate transporter substrate binding protein [Xanthobacteraceae bacterium]|jgi:tripartite-type tricarboxylate transporter receptor subunit TctC